MVRQGDGSGRGRRTGRPHRALARDARDHAARRTRPQCHGRPAPGSESSHFATAPAAKRLARSHPDVAGKLYRALGMRIAKGRADTTRPPSPTSAKPGAAWRGRGAAASGRPRPRRCGATIVARAGSCRASSTWLPARPRAASPPSSPAAGAPPLVRRVSESTPRRAANPPNGCSVSSRSALEKAFGVCSCVR